jgi:hypothetical protein
MRRRLSSHGGGGLRRAFIAWVGMRSRQWSAAPGRLIFCADPLCTNGPDTAQASEIFMMFPVVRAAVTAAAVTSLVCSVTFASAIATEMAFTGLLHLPGAVDKTLDAVIVGATLWIGVWLFRRAYAVERQMEGDAQLPEIQ